MKVQDRRARKEKMKAVRKSMKYYRKDGVSRKKHDELPSDHRYHLSHTHWYYEWCMPAPTKKKKRQQTQNGKNKGKSMISSKVITFHAHVECKREGDFPLIIEYKDNSPKEIIPDPNKPICVVCYHHNSGSGRKIFKACKHGSDMCWSCARQLITCPVCRGPRRI